LPNSLLAGKSAGNFRALRSVMRFLPLSGRETGTKQIAKFPHSREYQGIAADAEERRAKRKFVE
jgi:hypothetical protein